MKKRLLALVLCLIMVACVFPIGALAEDGDDVWEDVVLPVEEEEEEASVEEKEISLAGLEAFRDRPLYEGSYSSDKVFEIYSSDERIQAALLEKLNGLNLEARNAAVAEMPTSSTTYLKTLKAAGAALSKQIKARPDEVEPYGNGHVYFAKVYYQAASGKLDTVEERDTLWKMIQEYAYHVTGDPMEGDYLRRSVSLGYVNPQCTVISTSSGTTYVCCEYAVGYWADLTYAQEQKMAKAADAILKELGFTSKTSGYDKIKAIYNWIGDNITYDYAALEDDELIQLDQTAYSAIMNRTTVCAGYSHLMYYMMWKSQIPTRIISGTGAGGNHAWNTTYLRGKWYSMDVTWDAGYKLSDPCTFDWFLRGRDSGFYGSGSGNTHATNRDKDFDNTGLVNATNSSDYGSRRSEDNGKCSSHTSAKTYYKSDSGTVVHWCSKCGQSIVGNFAVKPGKPELVSVKLNDGGGVLFKWNKASNAKKYTVLRKVGSSGSWKTLATTTKTSYVDEDVTAGKTYYYSVRAVSADGTKGSYDSTGLKIKYIVNPKQPELVSATVKDDGILFKWKAASGAVKYRVYRKTGNGGWKYQSVTTKVSYKDTEVTVGKTYTYTVRSVGPTGKLSTYDKTGIKIKMK